MDETLIYFNKYEDWKATFNIMKCATTEYMILCIASLKNYYFTLYAPLYFSLSSIAYRIKLNRQAILKLAKLSSLLDDEFYPCIIHNHMKYNSLEFSGVDYKFETSMNNLLQQMGNKRALMILFGESNEDVILRSENIGTMTGKLII